MADLKEDKLISKETSQNTFYHTAKDSSWNALQKIWYFLKEELPQFLSNWRTVPRLMMILYGFAFYEVVNWFMALENPNNAQAGLVSVVVGAGAAWFGLYVNGKKTEIQKHNKK